MLHNFHCVHCKKDKTHETPAIGGGVGYATYPDGTVCYDCCAKRDTERMSTAQTFTLYFVREGDGWKVTNWPGTLSFRAYSVTSERKPGKVRRYAFTFTDADGKRWEGKNNGNDQIARCRRVRQRRYQTV